MVYKIGNRKDTSLWYDNRSQIGPLSQLISQRDIYDARLYRDMKVCEMIKNGKWCWPEEWYERFPMITSIDVSKFNSLTADKIIWKDNDGEWDKFSVNVANTTLCPDRPDVPCEDLLHLFFKCEFSCQVWEKAKTIANIRSFTSNRSEIVQEVNNMGNGNSIGSHYNGLEPNILELSLARTFIVILIGIGNQSIECDHLNEIGMVENLVEFLSFTFGDKEMILMI
ncbi:hypothetical protein Tco_0392945 [Tanacetum coccineum]